MSDFYDDEWAAENYDRNSRGQWIERESPTVYECPYCFAMKPSGEEVETWACCGEVGHAVKM